MTRLRTKLTLLFFTLVMASITLATIVEAAPVRDP